MLSFTLGAEDVERITNWAADKPGPPGDVFDVERDRDGPHGQIMKYNLNRDE